MRNQQPFSQEQYEMLKRCSDKKDLTEWNDWRKSHPDTIIWLQGGDFKGWWLQHANFMHVASCNFTTGKKINYTGEVHFEESVFEGADLRGANFDGSNMNDTKFWSAHAEGASFGYTSLIRAKLGTANFENCDFRNAILKNASFTPSQLNGANFLESNLRGCSLRACVVDGSTQFWNCIINSYSKNERFTDFTGTALNNVIITPGEKQLLEYNVRRQNWEEWYPEQYCLLAWPVRNFWQISDYGVSTKQIIKTFFAWAVIFAGIYLAWGLIDYYLLDVKDYPGIVSNLFVLEDSQQAVSPWLIPLRAVYFSIVTMTTLGFGDMYANAHSAVRGIFGHLLLALQVILGYVLLGALVTRFAVLFTAGGPAGMFADDKIQKTDDGGQRTEEG